MKQKLLIGSAVASVVLLAGGIYALYAYFTPGTQTITSEPPAVQEVVLNGKETCLPHRDTDGPVTLECMLGFQATDGTYYGLDMPQALRSEAIMTGSEFEASGQLVPVAMLSSDHWWKYDIDAIFIVKELTSVHTDVEEPDGDEVVIPPTTPTVPYKPLPSETPGECYVGGCSGQLCSDQPDMVSTCEWREEYACYREATCERQANGQCGWSNGEEVSKCVQSAR